MSILKTITTVFAAAVISLSVQAQASTTTTGTTAKTTTTKSTTATKTTDPVNPNLKGPNGEVVYKGPKDGDYYFNKNTGKKAYIPKSKSK